MSRRYYAKDAFISWEFKLDSDAEFARKLEREFMMDDYREEAEKRGVSLERFFALLLQESLETNDS